MTSNALLQPNVVFAYCRGRNMSKRPGEIPDEQVSAKSKPIRGLCPMKMKRWIISDEKGMIAKKGASVTQLEKLSAIKFITRRRRNILRKKVSRLEGIQRNQPYHSEKEIKVRARQILMRRPACVKTLKPEARSKIDTSTKISKRSTNRVPTTQL